MSREDYLFLFQILSATAVIISIIHLGYQIRQNTKALRRTASRDIVHDLNELGRFFIEIPELIGIYFDATEKPEGLTKADRFRFQTLLLYIFSNFDLALAYHGDGLIGDDAVDVYTGSVQRLLESPIAAEWWNHEGRNIYSENLQSRISSHRTA